MGRIQVEGESGQRLRWDDVYTEIETPERMMRWAATHHPMIVPLMSKQRVLEVGTGTGMLSGFLASAGVDVTTIDVSESVIDIASRFYERIDVKVNAVLADGTATDFESDTFDAVYSQGLWEHFENQQIQQFATEGLRLARVVYASVPSVAYPRLGRHGPGLAGNERFLSAVRWRSILKPLSASTLYYADWKILTMLGFTFPYPNHLLIELRR